MSEALLVVRWLAPGEHRVLAVHPEESWVWVLAGSGDWAGLVGTFRAATQQDDRSAATEIAALVVDEPEAGTGVLTLTVTAGDLTRRVAASSTLAARIVGAFTSLTERARHSPVSAFVVTAMASNPAGHPVLGVGFTSLGSEPVVLTVDPEGATAVTADGSVNAIPPVRMGLVSGDTTLLDGLYAPAELAPGVVGGWVLPQPTDEPVATVRVRGTAIVTGPFPDGVPELAFEAATQTMPRAGVGRPDRF